ncbi:MAG: PD-(D/E)XK nuclease family protein [Acidobacteriota bacterium]
MAVFLMLPGTIGSTQTGSSSMGSPKLIASAGPERIGAAHDWLVSRNGSVLIVSSSKGAADGLARSAGLKRGGSIGWQRYSLSQFALDLASGILAERHLVPLTRTGFEALTARCIHHLAARDELEYFTPIMHASGFPAVVAATLRELRLNAVVVHDLSEGSGRMRDTARLLAALEDQLRAASAADSALVLEAAREAVRRRSDELGASSLLLLDVVPGSLLECRFIAALTERCRDLLATVLETDAEALRTLEELLEVQAQSLPSALGTRYGLNRMQVDLFGALEAIGQPQEVTPDSTVEFFSAAGEGQECVEIARRILEAAGDGVAFDRMAVLLRDSGNYRPQLDDAFRRAGIPGYFTRGILRPDSEGRAFLCLLSCGAEGFSAARFAEYLALAESPHSIAWEDLLIEASIVTGRERWERRLEGLGQKLVERLDSLDEEAPDARFLRAKLGRLQSLQDFALPLIDSLGSLPEGQTWGSWITALSRLARQALNEPQRVSDVLRELEPMADVGPVHLQDVRRLLSRRLRDFSDAPADDPYGKVFVGRPEEAAGRAFDLVFVPGLSEGIFPRKVFEDPILLDEDRRHLGGRLRTRRDRIRMERRLLLLPAGASSSKFIASFPRMDFLQGRARVPSLFSLELLRAVEGRLPDLDRFDHRIGDRTVARLGWPAPLDPRQAIDQAEFDLAVLEPLLHGGTERIRGRGRFLLDVNPWLARSLRTRFKRWSPAWSDDDGLVAPREPAILEILNRHRLAARSHSPTSLQTYAQCPYRYFLHAVQRLRCRDRFVVVEQMDPLLRGSLVHSVQFELFRSLDADQLLPFAPAHADEILDRVDRILDAVAGRYAEQVLPVLPRVWQTQIEGLRVDLRSWVREVISQDEGWCPYRWEFAFGLPAEAGRDPRSLPEPVAVDHGFLIRGVVDLIEKGRDGRIRVIDHKTGKTPSNRPRMVGGGEFLQPLLYGLAVERSFAAEVTSGLLSYCTQRGDFERIELPLNAASRPAVMGVLEQIDDAVDRGFLPTAPRPGACSYCDYRIICGPYEELRGSLKDPFPIADLQKLRELP